MTLLSKTINYLKIHPSSVKVAGDAYVSGCTIIFSTSPEEYPALERDVIDIMKNSYKHDRTSHLPELDFKGLMLFFMYFSNREGSHGD